MPLFDAMMTRGQRLRKARKEAGYESMTDAVAALCMNYATYAGHETDKRDYGPDDAKRYARLYNVKAGWLLIGETSPSVTAPLQTGIAMIPITGIVRAGTWQDVNAGDSDLYQYVPSALDWPPEWQFAYTVEGNSLDRIAPSGSVLICLDLIKARGDHRSNLSNQDLVIIERTRYGGEMIERTAKRVNKTRNGFELWPESNDPAHQEPIIIDGPATPDEETRVTGKVLWIMKRP